MFEGFELSRVNVGEVALRVRHGGSGAPLLLLHGHPQTHMMWGKIADRLAEEFTVVAPDLRGYGESSKPPSTPDHLPYSKRVMAQDQVNLMQHFGFESFFVAGHDRGGRCAYRMALDHPERVLKLVVLDILPTWEHFRRGEMQFALEWWHWFFLAQPADMPEHLINADPDYFYWKRHSEERPEYHAPEAFEDYRRCWNNPETVHAFCEDYRAGASIDFELDAADYGKKKISCPLLVLWSARNTLNYDMLGIWRDWAENVRGRALDCGHYLAEEAPDETYAELRAFFGEGSETS